MIFTFDSGHERMMPSFPFMPLPRILVVAVGLVGWLCAYSFAHAKTKGVSEVKVPSSTDGSLQWTRFFAPSSPEPVPLVVILHSWSANWKQTLHRPIEDYCVKKGWAYLHPDFRGPNRRPQATGSALVVSDIVDAVEFACRETKVDRKRVFLLGTSGGGYASLLMAGKRPGLWAGVSAWVPISDLRAWHKECKAKRLKYARDIELSCGGVPGSSPEVDREYVNRSPLTFLKRAKGVNLSINAGILDGHKGSVPISHSLLAFNEVARAEDRLSMEEIGYFTEKAKVPESLVREITDSSFGRKVPVFRRTSGSATVTIFQGGHELVASAALAWLEDENKRILKGRNE
ncbi:MAG TPA: prolyl oligopeptidase [Opitutae bacterium]|nr:prolyl oligopeptidase [Opitutae bacterium]